LTRHLTAILTFAVLGLAACGGDDKTDAETTVREFVKATNSRDSERFCTELVTQEFAEQATGAKGEKARDTCQQQFKSLKGLKLRLVRLERTKIDGDKATVRAVLAVQGQQQDQLYRLEKEDGTWKLAGGAGG
jgi:ABC-type glycerol-3-phosphate transport system substrate-binding protein